MAALGGCTIYMLVKEAQSVVGVLQLAVGADAQPAVRLNAALIAGPRSLPRRASLELEGNVVERAKAFGRRAAAKQIEQQSNVAAAARRLRVVLAHSFEFEQGERHCEGVLEGIYVR